MDFKKSSSTDGQAKSVGVGETVTASCLSALHGSITASLSFRVTRKIA